jgi:hypothetical protein
MACHCTDYQTDVILQVIRVVSQAVPWYGSDFDERLLIHLSYSPRRCCIFLVSYFGFLPPISRCGNWQHLHSTLNNQALGTC